MSGAPPENLHHLDPLIHHTEPMETWFRSHYLAQHPIYFGRNGTGRWDAPDNSFGVLYLASDEFGAFMESIGRGVLRSRFIPKSMLEQRALSTVECRRSLRLIDLVASGGLARIGAEGSLTSSVEYAQSRLWSAALRKHPSRPDGILYASRHDPTRLACALFDRCESAIRITRTFGPWAGQQVLLGKILDHYQFGTDL